MLEHSSPARIRTRLGLALMLALAGCGGGGGGDGTTTDASAPIALSTANRDTVAHATASGAMSAGAIGSIPVAGASVQPGVNALPVGTGGAQASAAVARVLAVLQSTLAGRAPRAIASVPTTRVQTISGPETSACALSGTVSVTFDDRDNSGVGSVGDVVTVAFNNCADSSLATINGSASVTVTSLNSASQFGGIMVLANLAASETNHSTTLNGSVAFNFSSSSGTDTIGITADSDLVASAHTHVFDDTVTLKAGFVQSVSVDSNGRATITMSGQLVSRAAGGAVSVTTPVALVADSNEDYPHAGVLQITGTPGQMRLIVQSASNVLVELDADGNGLYESSNVVAWDWLL